MDDYGDDNAYAVYGDDDDDGSAPATAVVTNDDDYEDDLDDFALPDEDLNGLHIVDKDGNEEPTPEDVVVKKSKAKNNK